MKCSVEEISKLVLERTGCANVVSTHRDRETLQSEERKVNLEFQLLKGIIWR